MILQFFLPSGEISLPSILFLSELFIARIELSSSRPVFSLEKSVFGTGWPVNVSSYTSPRVGVKYPSIELKSILLLKAFSLAVV